MGRLRLLWELLVETLRWLELEAIGRLDRLRFRLETEEMLRRIDLPGYCDWCAAPAWFHVTHDDGRVREACHDCTGELTAGMARDGARLYPGWRILRIGS